MGEKSKRDLAKRKEIFIDNVNGILFEVFPTVIIRASPSSSLYARSSSAPVAKSITLFAAEPPALIKESNQKAETHDKRTSANVDKVGALTQLILLS